MPYRFLLLAIQEILQFLEHRLNVIERAIYTRKANVGYLIHLAQSFHYKFSNDTALDFLFSLPVQFLLNLLNRVLNLVDWQRTFLTSFADTHEKLLPVKCFPALISLDNHQNRFLDTLVRTEASFALFAFASSMNGITNISRIFHA
jgi:hypothetical protein